MKINFRTITVLWVSSLMMLVANWFFNNVGFLKAILSLFIFTFMCSTICRKRFFDGMGIAFTLMFVLFLSEMFFSLLLFITNINFSIVLNTVIGQISSNIAIGLICYLATCIKKINISLKNFVLLLGKNNNMIIISIIVLVMGILTNKNGDVGIELNYVMNLLLVVIFGIIICALFIEKRHKDILESNQEVLYNYIMKYEKELIEKSKIIHDFKNELITIKGLVCGNNCELKEYLKETINDSNKNDISILKDLNNIPLGGLKGLLYFKLADIDKMEIKLALIIGKKLSKLEKVNPGIYKEIVKIIGVYLDNAIEAAIKAKEKRIEIEIYEQGNQLNFIISNTYNDKILVSKLGDVGYSSKGKNRGYGLAFVKDVLERNKNFKEKRDITKNIYSVTLTIGL